VLIGRLTSEIHDAIGLGGASEPEEKMMALAIATLHEEDLIDIEEASLDKPIAEPTKIADKAASSRGTGTCSLFSSSIITTCSTSAQET
jgi:hypothetical protein